MMGKGLAGEQARGGGQGLQWGGPGAAAEGDLWVGAVGFGWGVGGRQWGSRQALSQGRRGEPWARGAGVTDGERAVGSVNTLFMP